MSQEYKPRYTWTIYELDPCEDPELEEEDGYRFVQMFDNEEDAKKVLDVLESVNVHFHVYTLVKMEFKY